MAPWMKTFFRKKKKNHNFVVKVYVPEPSASSTYRFKPFQEERVEKKSEAGKKLEFSDLPADSVENILERLYSADRIRFGSTCKKNLSFVTSKHHPHRYEFRTIDRIPWLAHFFCSGCFRSPFYFDFRLFEPLHLHGRPHYATYEIHNPKGHGLGSGIYGQLKASRKGWFLCLWPKQEDEQQAGLTSLLLFSPFNKRIIKLPDLDVNLRNSLTDYSVISHATFSSDPSSPDCVYFFLSQDVLLEKISISTLHQKSRKWKTKLFDYRRRHVSVSCVVYHEGCFFCPFDDGRLVAYDVFRHTLDIFIPSYPVPFWDSRMRVPFQDHILVCEGKLLLAYLEIPPGSGYNIEKLRCGLFEFSSSTKTWVRRTSLGNHALFLGDPTSFAVPVSSSWSRCDENIAERMYFYPTILHRAIYYSFKDGRCHAPKEGGYWSSSTGLVGRRTWIEPPLSPSELA